MTKTNIRTKVKNINGLSIERHNDGLKVYYEDRPLEQIGYKEERCMANTEYFGSLTFSERTYASPIGIIRRRYRSWGAGLEYYTTEWDLVEEPEIKELQEEFQRLSEKMTEVKQKLRMLCLREEE